MNFETPSQPENTSERIKRLEQTFLDAENVLEAGDRESAKEAIKGIYSEILILNKTDGKEVDWRLQWEWNKEGNLSEEQFNNLNLRRKMLSNAIGIMTSSGVIRHDLNDI